VPDLRGRLLDRNTGQTGIVHQCVDPSEFRKGAGDDRIDIGQLTDISGNDQSGISDELCGFAQRRFGAATRTVR